MLESNDAGVEHSSCPGQSSTAVEQDNGTFLCRSSWRKLVAAFTLQRGTRGTPEPSTEQHQHTFPPDKTNLEAPRAWSMPQASLLDFFQSRNAGPFAPAALPVEPSRSEKESAPGVILDVRREYDRGGLILSQQSPGKHLKGAAPASSPDCGQDDERATSDSTGSSPLVDVKGLTIVAVENCHLGALKRLTANLLPVRYPDKFFDCAVSESIPATFSRVALIDGRPVGWIRCRLDPFPAPTVPASDTKPVHNCIYVQALCLLAPYRGLGIAKALLDTITSPPLPHDHNIAHVYAHVWESNEEALEWYDRRGFKRVMKVDQYYRKLRPDGAWIMKKALDT